MVSPRLIALASSLSLVPSLFAQQDAPAIDINQLVQALRTIKDQQTLQVKSSKQKAIQEAQAASGSAAAAVNAWEEAVRQVQFEGAAREGAQFREWKEKEGVALGEKEAQNAARLYFSWLHLTLQRSAGLAVKDLLPQIIQYTKELTADQLAMDALDDRIKHEKELIAKRPGVVAKDKRKEDDAVKRIHDQILNRNLASSPPVQALKIAEYVNVPEWENSPGNADGIFQRIILKELRAVKDPRLLDYWDMKLKREGEAAAKTKLAFETEKFSQVRRPELLWLRAQDELILGQKNKALGDMFAVIKAFPAHPEAAAWVAQLEQMLVPAPISAPTTSSAPAAPVAAGGAPGTR